MADGGPNVPKKTFFYNLKHSIDDPYNPLSVATLDSPTSCYGENIADEPPSTATDAECKSEVALYSQPTLRRAIYPIAQWIPFNPGDNNRLRQADASGDPVPVGYGRLLFQVHGLASLRSIYWLQPYSTKVSASHWVFSDTLTPIDPVWDETILRHFNNFIENLEVYQETLEKAVNEPALIKVIVQRVDLKQAGKTLAIDLVFSPKNSNVYMFRSGSSFLATKSTASSLLEGSSPRGTTAILQPFDFVEYKKLYSVEDRLSDDPAYEPAPVNRLILVFHGVGQKLSDSYSRINFVYAIDKLRVQIAQATDSEEVYQHFPGKQGSIQYLVLAVNWRAALKTDPYLNLEPVTVQSILPVRQAIGDALLDIPLYMSENRRPAMLAAAAAEANRLYNLVVKNHPSFKENGEVNIVGHSLGSLITADLLTHQPTILDEFTLEKAPFKFQTKNYFTTGSMLGVFMLLKGEKLIPRSEYDATNGNERSKNRPFGCFAVRNLYNIINQSDVLSYLVNSTVKGAKESGQSLIGERGLPLEADELPSGPLIESLRPKLSDTPRDDTSLLSRRETISRFISSRFSKSPEISRDTSQEPSIEPESSSKERHSNTPLPREVEELRERLQSLNENGQLDWKIPIPASYLPNHYFKMFTAHFDYWSNKEIARFIAIECGRSPGPHNTLPQHRVKWTFKSGQEES